MIIDSDLSGRHGERISRQLLEELTTEEVVQRGLVPVSTPKIVSQYMERHSGGSEYAPYNTLLVWPQFDLEKVFGVIPPKEAVAYVRGDHSEIDSSPHRGLEQLPYRRIPLQFYREKNGV